MFGPTTPNFALGTSMQQGGQTPQGGQQFYTPQTGMTPGMMNNSGALVLAGGDGGWWWSVWWCWWCGWGWRDGYE